MMMSAAFSMPADFPLAAGGRRARSNAAGQGGWKELIDARLTELMQLPAGWDGYHAVPVQLDNAAFAFSLLSSVMNQGMPLPAIVPTVDGSVQIEWHTSKGDIELRVRRPNSVHAWFSQVGDDKELEVDLAWDFQMVSTWLNEIKENDFAAEPAAA